MHLSMIIDAEEFSGKRNTFAISSCKQSLVIIAGFLYNSTQSPAEDLPSFEKSIFKLAVVQFDTGGKCGGDGLGGGFGGG